MVNYVVGKFIKEYQFTEPFYRVYDEAKRLYLLLEQQFTGQYYLSELKNINQLYLQHFVEPMTRVNYGSNLGEVHALGTFISLAPQEAQNVYRIQGGNYRLFENFVKHSKADLRLNTKVGKVTKVVNNKGETQYEILTKDGNTDTYDAVILAAPIVSIILFYFYPLIVSLFISIYSIHCAPTRHSKKKNFFFICLLFFFFLL